MLATVAFGVVYLLSWLRLRRERQQLGARPPVPVSLGWFLGLVALGVVMVLCLGQEGTASAVYISVLAVILFPARVALVLVVADAALLVVLGELVPGWSSGAGVAFAVCAAAVAMYGIQQMMLRNLALMSAHAENAELAVENERTRFARDLHDILGHSLTVITVKAELANKLLDVDTDRARAELADLERLSRDALADVRRAVEGYRELSLPGELARARTALEAAGIDADLPNSVDDVPSDRRELFAWAIREGVTNVIRHSGATRCRVELHRDRVVVADDGRGPQPGATGHGLTGLQERARAAQGTVVTRVLEPGFSLSVVLP
jgi:two-component system sensor histidine kinase DesK